jgi:hypothetical protein
LWQKTPLTDQATSRPECRRDLGCRPQARRARCAVQHARDQGSFGIEAEVALGHGFDRQPRSAAGEREGVDQSRMAEQVNHLATPFPQAGLMKSESSTCEIEFDHPGRKRSRLRTVDVGLEDCGDSAEFLS